MLYSQLLNPAFDWYDDDHDDDCHYGHKHYDDVHCGHDDDDDYHYGHDHDDDPSRKGL